MPRIVGADSCILARVVIVLACVPFGVGRVSLARDFPKYFFPALQGQSECVAPPHLLAEGIYLPERPGFLLHPAATALPQTVWRKAWHRWSSSSALKCSLLQQFPTCSLPACSLHAQPERETLQSRGYQGYPGVLGHPRFQGRKHFSQGWKVTLAGSLSRNLPHEHPLMKTFTNIHQTTAPRRPPGPRGEEPTAGTAGKNSSPGWQWWGHSPAPHSLRHRLDLRNLRHVNCHQLPSTVNFALVPQPPSGVCQKYL